MAELADAPDLGSGGVTCPSSNLGACTIICDWMRIMELNHWKALKRGNSGFFVVLINTVSTVSAKLLCPIAVQLPSLTPPHIKPLYTRATAK
jgi:hypothetical protein